MHLSRVIFVPHAQKAPQQIAYTEALTLWRLVDQLRESIPSAMPIESGWCEREEDGLSKELFRSFSLRSPKRLQHARSCRLKESAMKAMRRSLWLIPLKMNLVILPICAVLILAAAPAWAELNPDEAAA